MGFIYFIELVFTDLEAKSKLCHPNSALLPEPLLMVCMTRILNNHNIYAKKGKPKDSVINLLQNRS